MANNEEKPREKGLGEYARDFIKGMAGRDDNDTPNTAQSNAATEREHEKPRDQGFMDYTRDFIKDMVGRGDDDEQKPSATQLGTNDNVRTTAQEDSQNSSIFGRLGESAVDAAKRVERERQQEQAGSFSGIGESLRNAAEEARQKQQSATASQAHDMAEAARNAAKQAQAHTSATNPALSDTERAELEKLRSRVQELEQQKAAPAAAQRTYTVKPGDTLRAISERFYGDEMKWKRIYEANRAAISNPDIIHVGQEFIIPE